MRLRILAALLTALLLLSCLAACAETNTDQEPENSENETQLEPDPFANVNYDGREFWIYTSVNVAATAMGNSNIRVTGIRKRTSRSEWSDAGVRESVQPFRMGDWN